ncbi:MAG: hypothetical protein IK015_04430, partial [Treponema sp.]|nr:hypothetical protein [Treponema sp.]
VFMVNREFRKSISRLFHKDHLAMAIFLPIAIVCLVMIAAKFLLTLIIEQTTDLWSFNTGRVQEKMGTNKNLAPQKTPVSFVLLDNSHLTEQGVKYFCAKSSVRTFGRKNLTN